MTLASPFVKGGSKGILLSHRLLKFNNNFLIDQISPNPSLLKRGIKRILSQSQMLNSEQASVGRNKAFEHKREQRFRHRD